MADIVAPVSILVLIPGTPKSGRKTRSLHPISIMFLRVLGAIRPLQEGLFLAEPLFKMLDNRSRNINIRGSFYTFNAGRRVDLEYERTTV